MGFRVLVTGGAGFVGSSLALALKRDHPDWAVTSLDNLQRKGSELNLDRLKAGGVAFRRGDVRKAEDLEAAGPVDLLIECSAEPSVHAGYGENPRYLIETNLIGTVNCLEYLRRHGGGLIFLSTSRVYPIAALRALPLVEEKERLVIRKGASGPGWSERGIAENFPLDGSRSLYGTTKLASELLIEEYRTMYGLRAVINRCGVLTGPWQMGKVDQGFVVLWMARHFYGGALAYTGFGGKGLQVRDILDVADLYGLVASQIARLDRLDGAIYNVGGGVKASVSLRELTNLCRRLTGKTLSIGGVEETRPADVPYYVSDCRKVEAAIDWRPRRDLEATLGEIHRWLSDQKGRLEPLLKD